MANITKISSILTLVVLQCSLCSYSTVLDVVWFILTKEVLFCSFKGLLSLLPVCALFTPLFKREREREPEERYSHWYYILLFKINI